MNVFSLLENKIGQKVIPFLIAHENESFYLRELANVTKTDPSNLSKYLKYAKQADLIITYPKGNLILIEIKTSNPLYPELKKITNKTVGIEGQIKLALKNLRGLKQAFIYGSYAQDQFHTASDIDLFVIGEIDENQLLKNLNLLENKLNREINYILMTESEFSKKKKSDSFIKNIIKHPTIELYA